MTDAGLAARMAAFARERVRGHPGLERADAFPFDLWRGFAGAGLLGVTLPAAFGGLGLDAREQAAAAEALVRHGRNLGIALAWQGQNALARFLVAGFGTAAQQARWLPELASGRAILAVAISEPGAGAHPKRLSTRAARRGGGFVLNGEKAYVTNGPIADLFVILAVTAEEAGRKRFTAFLVPKDAPGLVRHGDGGVDYLRPAMHCSLTLTELAVPAEAILGAEGEAYDAIARPLRAVEDALGLGTLAGAMAALLDMAGEGAAAPDDAARRLAGGMAASVAVVRTLADAALARLDADPGDEAAMPLLLGARRLVRQFLDDHAALCAALGRDPGPILARDLGKLAGIARYVEEARLSRLGEAALGGLV